MTDNTDTETDAQIEDALPETTTFEVQTTKVVEVDFSEQAIQQMMQQTGADTPEEAIQMVRQQSAAQSTAPEEKLVAVHANAEPSDDSSE